jgi:hypothetical protein
MRRLVKKKNRLWMPVFIIAVMVLSVIGFSMLQGENTNAKKMNGVTFTKTGDAWKFRINGIELMSYFTPDQLANISSGSVSDFPYFTYLTSNPQAKYPQQDLITIELAKLELKNTLIALGYTPEMNFSDKITCKNATLAVGVIDLDLGNETAVRVENTCVRITGTNSQELVAARDKFVMLLAGLE